MRSKPWEDAPDLWKDEKAFCQWLRSQTRRIWARHPIKNRYTASVTVNAEKVPGFKVKHPRAKKARPCEMCKEYFPAKLTEVDHIEPAGSFHTVEDYYAWLTRLLVLGFDDIRVLCKTCHLNVTLAEKMKCEIDEVWAYKAVADFNKLKVKDARKAAIKQGIDPEGLNLKQLKAEYKLHMMEAIGHA